jgi:hypothetical protein
MKSLLLLFLVPIILQADYIPKKNLKEKQAQLKSKILNSIYFSDKIYNFKVKSEDKISETKRILNNSSPSQEKGYYENMYKSIISY